MNKQAIGNAVACLLCAILVAIHTRSQAKASVQEGVIESALEVVTYHKYQDTVSSLIEAIYNNNVLVATSAATLLRRHTQSKQAVAALENAITDPRERVAVAAAYSLVAIGNKEWVQNAVARLPVMEDPVPQTQMAGVLARAGRTEGLKYVINTILDSKTTSIGLDQLVYFDGKLTEQGESIGVVDELSSLTEKASPEVREKILEKIKQLRAAGNR